MPSDDFTGVGCWRCGHCNKTLRNHAAGGACLFSSTKFKPTYVWRTNVDDWKRVAMFIARFLSPKPLPVIKEADMIHSSRHVLTQHTVELTPGEVKQALVEYLINRRPHMCPLELAEDAKHMLERHGTSEFKITTEEQETRNGEPGTRETITIIEFICDRSINKES